MTEDDVVEALFDIFLNDRLQKSTKEKLSKIIRAVARMRPPPDRFTILNQSIRNPHAQAPSILAKYPDLANSNIGLVDPVIGPSAVPIEAIAQTPATAAAMQERQQAINASLSGKVEPGRTSPRKIGRQ